MNSNFLVSAPLWHASPPGDLDVQTRLIHNSFLVITRSHELGFARNLVKMNPTALPELSKPSRTPRSLKNMRVFRDQTFLYEFEDI